MAKTLADLSDVELEEEIEARVREQEARRVAALRALRTQSSFFLPNRLYASAR